MITNKQIRQHYINRRGVRSVVITRSGRVVLCGTMPRNDGGRRTWRQFVGYRHEIIDDVANEIEFQKRGAA